MGEERKEDCLLCLPCDSALYVVFFLFYQLRRKEASLGGESLAFSLQRRDSPPLAHYPLTGDMEWRLSLLAGCFYIIRVHTVNTLWAFASILIFLTKVIIFRRGKRPPRRKQFFRSPRLTRWRQGCVWRRRWRSVWKDQSTKCYSVQVLDTNIYNTVILK